MSIYDGRAVTRDGLDAPLLRKQRTPLKVQLERMRECAFKAERAGQNASAWRAAALALDERGMIKGAQEARNRGQMDHLEACRHLAELADLAKALMTWAAVGWRPSLDVAGSGLKQRDIDRICFVMGTVELPEVDADEAPF